ncbi:MAG TPA: ABC transporter substrate-binding protein [Marmoricola sp.]|nr:ABC transporter substrate-binding protein [Marmoricola sp.]
MPNNTKRVGLSMLAVVSMLTLAACGSSGGGGGGNTNNSGQSAQNGGTQGAVSGGTLNLLGQSDVDYMDPNVSYYTIGYLGLRMWSRQLFTYPATPGKTTTAVPDLATSVPTQANGGISKDGKTVTITLRKGAKWNTSPARQVTAADVVRGVKRTCNPTQPFGGTPDFATLIDGYTQFCSGFAKVSATSAAAQAKYIENTPLPGVVAKNELTVQFKLTSPASYFVDMLTMPAFSPAPKEQLKYLPGSNEQAQHTISDGPYQVESYNATKSIVFTRNPAWSSSSDPIRHAYVDKIVVDETVSQDSAQQQLQTGTASADMEWDDFPPPSQLPGLIAKQDPNLNLGPTASSNPYVVFNTVSPNNGKALEKTPVRQALEYALNRDDMIRVLGGPKINPPLTHVLPSNIVGSQNINLYKFNPDKAKQMLKQAGVSGMNVKVLYRSDSEGSRKLYQVIQQDLSKVGINVTGVPSTASDFYTKYLEKSDVAKRGVWDLAIAGWGADWYGNAALSFFGPLFSGAPSYPPNGSNFGFYNNPQVNKLVQQASTATSESQSAATWEKADMQVMKDAAFFPITSPKQANYHASQVHNAVYVPAFQNFDPTNVWLSKDKQGG